MIEIPDNIDAKLKESYRQLINSLEDIGKTAMTIKRNRDALVTICREMQKELRDHNSEYHWITTEEMFANWEKRIKAAQENS